ESSVLEASLDSVAALVPGQRAEHPKVRVMPRLFGKYRTGLFIASQICRVVSIVPREVRNQIWGEDMLPRYRLHVVVGAPPLILSLFFMVGEIRNVELLVVAEYVKPEDIFLARSVIEFEKTFYCSPVIVEVLDCRRIQKSIGGRACRAD